MFFLFFIFLFFYFSLRRINSAGVEGVVVEVEETKGGEKAAPRSPSVDD